MTDLEQRIADETARAMLRHNLKQAYERLGDARASIKVLRALDLPDTVVDDLMSVANRIEVSMWRVEQRVLEMDGR